MSRAMPVGGNPINPKRKNFFKLGERFGLSIGDCNSMIDQVAGIATNAGKYLEEAGVNQPHATAVVSALEQSLRNSLQ